MATQQGTADVLPGVYPIAGVNLTMLAPLANGDSIQYPASGNDLIIQFNGTGADTGLVLNAGVDPYGRADGSSMAAVPSTAVVVFGPLTFEDGWPLAGAKLQTTVVDVAIKTACLALGRAG